jgi:putative transposase
MKNCDDFKPSTFYHVFNHAVGNEKLFRNAENFEFFFSKYDYYMNPVWDTYAYCIMPNHFHLLIKVKPIEELKENPKCKDDIHKYVMKCLSNLLNSYAKSYNIYYSRKGALFLDYTRRIEIDNKNYYKNVLNYIHQNPVHHGFCKDTKEWRYSSYLTFLSERATKTKRDEVLAWFDGQRQNYEIYHATNIEGLKPEYEFL